MSTPVASKLRGVVQGGGALPVARWVLLRGVSTGAGAATGVPCNTPTMYMHGPMDQSLARRDRTACALLVHNCTYALEAPWLLYLKTLGRLLTVGTSSPVDDTIERTLSVIQGVEQLSERACTNAPQVVAVKAPGFGERKSSYLEDIAILTGGTVVKDELGITLDKATEDVLGVAAKVRVY